MWREQTGTESHIKLTNSCLSTGTIRVSVGMFLCVVKACVATLIEAVESFFEDRIHPCVRKHYRPQLSRRKSPGGRRETTCYERRLGKPKAAAWTCLEEYPSSACLDTKDIITSCQRFSPLLKTKAAKLKRRSIAQQKHDQRKLFPTKAAWQ